MYHLFDGLYTAAIFFLLIGPKKHNFVEDVEILLFVKYRCRGEVANVSANQRPGMPSCFSKQPEKKNKLGKGRWDIASCQDSLNSIQWFQRRSRAAILFFFSIQKHKLGRGRWYLASCQVSFNSVQRFQKRRRKCLSQSEVGWLSCFPTGTNLVKDVEILLSVIFRWIRFNGFRGEVENVSSNQRLGRPSCFSDRPENTNL